VQMQFAICVCGMPLRSAGIENCICTEDSEDCCTEKNKLFD
jgi:hypothetical protein